MKKSASYYASHPEAAAKKQKYQARYQQSPDRVAYRVELKRERRRRGIYGKGGPDMSHTTSGKMTPEDPSSNRARNGHGKNGRYKADDLVTVSEIRADQPAKGKKFSKMVTNPKTGRKNKVSYGAKGYSISPGTTKGNSYCARSFGDMKSHNKNCAGADKNTPLCLSRTKWKCSGKSSRSDSATVGEIRTDKKCGESGIAKNKQCSKRTAPSAKAGVIGGAVGLGVLGVGITAMTRRRGSIPRPGAPGIGSLAPRPTAGPPGGGGVSRVSVRDITRPRAALPPSAPTPRTLALPGRPAPRALFSPGAFRLGKTRRMRLNTQAAKRAAEQRIAQTAREEIRRIGQIGNTMAVTGEAAGMRLKTTVREVRLRLEAARRRFEPGYRAPGDGAKIPKALKASSSRSLPPAQTPLSSPIPFTPRPQAPERLRLGKTMAQARQPRSQDGRK